MFPTLEAYDAEEVAAPEGVGSIEEYIASEVDKGDDYVNIVCVIKGTRYHVFSMGGRVYNVELHGVAA